MTSRPRLQDRRADGKGAGEGGGDKGGAGKGARSDAGDSLGEELLGRQCGSDGRGGGGLEDARDGAAAGFCKGDGISGGDGQDQGHDARIRGTASDARTGALCPHRRRQQAQHQ